MAGLVPFNRGGSYLTPKGTRGFYNMLDDFFSDSFFPRNLIFDTFKVDVKEDEKAYKIEAELPGVNKEDISLSLNEGRLNISVRREEKVNEEKENYVHRERRYGSCERSIYLGEADPNAIEAKLEDGLLKVTVQKQDKAEGTKNIEIK